MAQRLNKGDARWLELKLENLDVEMWLKRVLQALQQGSRPLEALGPLERPR